MPISLQLPTAEELRTLLDPTPCNIVRELNRAGYEAYIVGGAIRDLLLSKTPKDYDISTSATPEEVRKVFGRRRCHVIGRRFRLAHVYANGEIYEVSTFRRQPDAKERMGRDGDTGTIIWNDNCFGTLNDDALRRDFTVNCLYYDVVGNRGIIDFCGGLQDIRQGVVRSIGDPALRFEEDPVRMLRALKLVGQCGFQLDPALDQALRLHAPSIRLASPSRLFEELLKLLSNPAAGDTLQVLHDHGLLQHFWPMLDESWNEQVGELVKHLLKLRGDAITRGRYSNSRGLALATVALPFMMFALNPENPTEFWERNSETDAIESRALGLIFEGFQLPNVFADRIRQIIGLVPRMLHHPISPRVFAHREYRYGRALVALLVQLFGWSPDKLAELPEFSPLYDTPIPRGAINRNAEGEEGAEEPAAGTGKSRSARRRRNKRSRRNGGENNAATAGAEGDSAGITQDVAVNDLPEAQQEEATAGVSFCQEQDCTAQTPVTLPTAEAQPAEVTAYTFGAEATEAPVQEAAPVVSEAAPVAETANDKTTTEAHERPAAPKGAAAIPFLQPASTNSISSVAAAPQEECNTCRIIFICEEPSLPKAKPEQEDTITFAPGTTYVPRQEFHNYPEGTLARLHSDAKNQRRRRRSTAARKDSV